MHSDSTNRHRAFRPTCRLALSPLSDRFGNVDFPLPDLKLDLTKLLTEVKTSVRGVNSQFSWFGEYAAKLGGTIYIVLLTVTNYSLMTEK